VKIFGVVDRLTVREIFTPTLLGFMTYTFLVIIRGVYNLIEQVLVRGVTAADAARVLLITLPHVVVLTIPMSFLFGVLLAAGRMNADSELVALQAGGIPIRRLLRPIMAFALVLTGLNSYLYLLVIPHSSAQLRELKLKLFAGARNLGRIEPGVFHEEIPNTLLYLRNSDPNTSEWHDIMLFDNSNPSEERLTLARSGSMVATGGAERVDMRPTTGELPDVEQWIRLEDVVTHVFSRDDPETYRVNRTKSQLIRPAFDGGGTVRYQTSMRDRSSLELVRFLLGHPFATAEGQPSTTDEDVELTRRHAAIELNKRLAIPFACVVFGLLALPLGIGSGSGGRGRGFVLSVAVVLAYYLVNNQGEMLAIEGVVPTWVGIWLPNIVLTVIAIALMARMGRWLGEREPLENPVAQGIRAIAAWWRGRRRSTTASRQFSDELSGSIPIAIQRRRYANIFPALLDRYLTRRLLPPLLLVVGSTALLYVVVDLSDSIEDMTKNHTSLHVILAYYANRIPQIFLDVTPIALMIAVLILLTVMEQQRELTALKAAGISLYRLAVPILLVAAFAAGGLWTLGEVIVPDSNREAQRLRDVIRGVDTARSYRSSDRQWLLSRNDESLYNFLRYDGDTQTLIRLTLFQIDKDMNLKYHLFTRRARFLDGKWIADSGWFRRFYPDGTDVFRRITGPMELNIEEGPAYFGQEYRRPSEMTVGELRSYISELVDSGYRPANLVVQWHQKFTYPLSAFVMVLLALPFALSRGGRRVSTMQGVAIALTLGIAYFMLVALFGKLGEVEILPPVVGAWSPVLLALLFAVNRLTAIRT
jgi:LPS export ABC transporter permease LptG